MKKIKGIISSVLSAVIIFAAMPMMFTASAESYGGTTGDCEWSLDGTALTISGNGEMSEYWDEDIPRGYEITEDIIESGVTNIGC